MRRELREGARTLLAALLPPRCPGCGDAADGVCLPCRAHLLVRPAGGCRRCEGALLPDGRCPEPHRDLRGLEFARAPFGYAGTGGALVRHLKLDGDLAAGRLLARAMAGRLAGMLHGEWRRAVLVPVPLHRRRRRERGFDQAHWLASGLARRLGLAEVAALRRIEATLPQGDVRVTSREQNVAQAFAAALPHRVRGRSVVLVDDVFTSGATARRCAEVLRDAGAAAVGVVTACRS